MALHFDANQFEQEFKPQRLRNWEVPKWYPSNPNINVGSTRIISNDRGHLLPGIPRPCKNPWGDYIGTWHLPKKISRKIADELSAPKQNKIKAWEKRRVRNEALKLNRSNEVPVEESPNVLLLDEEETAGEYHPPPCGPPEKKEQELVPYVPGDLTSPERRHDSYQQLSDDRFKQEQCRSSADGYPKSREDFSRRDPPPEVPLKDQVEEFVKKNKEMVQTEYPAIGRNNKKMVDRCLSPILAAISNFKLARKLHKENLQHEPLPDAVTDAMYRRWQMQRGGKDPGLALEEGECCTGVAWKGYPGYGATRCTKLKVYRPKTCVHNRQKSDQKSDRPNSVSSFDKKWRFIRQKKVSPIELAICWDLLPEDPKDEPKPTTHIDGSNGSMAPAVFTLVHTPKEDEIEEKSNTRNACRPLFEHAPGFDPTNTGLPIVNRPKTSTSSMKSDGSLKKRAQSAYNLQDKAVQYSKSSSSNSPSSKSNFSNKINHSSPDLTVDDSPGGCCRRCKKRRPCQACDAKGRPQKKQAKSEFKSAFKAGVPQKTKDKRQDYPEHWRLATVYQHSYKPLHLRKRPLLASVFK